ncbi:histone deacetylase family protein [Salinarimonas rosea]|uniref:histone deacetylase family protein n=1 Tax=Salinarimonas rosea TaxID=552063 RepID=UPI001FD99A50|nr:histone deacetylase family protein [Salinarimonas rosea]
MRVGRICGPNDLPTRTAALVGALRTRGVDPEVPAEAGLEPAASVHDARYLGFLESAYERWACIPGAGPEVLPNAAPYWNGSPERDARPGCRSPSVVAEACYYLGDLAVPIGPDTWQSALASSHSAWAAADAVIAGDKCAYALCRPSGHHARADRASGFCYLNNAAIAAQRLRSRFDRVAVLDVDAHHGDGTQEIFYRRSDVMTVSLHVDPEAYYPFFTGYADERGAGDGLGFNLNLPLKPRAGDVTVLGALDRALEAVARFGARALVVSLGFDMHRDDPLSMLGVKTAAYGEIGRRIADVRMPTVVVQEGGYRVCVIGACLGEFVDGLRAG